MQSIVSHREGDKVTNPGDTSPRVQLRSFFVKFQFNFMLFWRCVKYYCLLHEIMLVLPSSLLFTAKFLFLKRQTDHKLASLSFRARLHPNLAPMRFDRQAAVSQAQSKASSLRFFPNDLSKALEEPNKKL